MDVARRFYGFAQNGRPAFHVGDFIRERLGDVSGYSVEFGELDPAEMPAPRDCCGVSICLRCDGGDVGPFPGIYDNRPGRGHLYLVADPGPALAGTEKGPSPSR
jgi:hypothetical protein